MDLGQSSNLTYDELVVTGSTDGIGKAYATQLAKRGLNIVLVSRNAEKLERVASEIGSEFKVKTKIIVADFSDGPSVYDHIKTKMENIPVAVLVNNVAIASTLPYYIEETPIKFAYELIDVNILSAIMMIKLILPQMKQRKKGIIINVSSISESSPIPFGSYYSSSKAFLLHLSKLLQYEVSSYGIEVQLLSPFFVKTNMTTHLRQNRSIWVPDYETYARHAIKTLGFSSHTTGYWPHELIYFMSEMIPLKIRIHLAAKVMVPARRKFETKMKWASTNCIEDEGITEESIKRRKIAQRSL